MKKYKVVVTLAFCMFAVFACACQPQVVEVEVTRQVSMVPPEPIQQSELIETRSEVVVEKVAVSVEGDAVDVVKNVEVQQPQQQERLIIRTGYISMSVEDTDATMTQVESMVNGLGGWIVSSNANAYGNGVRGNMTVRVPAEHYSMLMNEYKNLAVEINSENASGQDVTDEYVDLASRLKNLEATADRVRSFLDDADSVEEALDVNKELSRLEEEIEVIKGRMQYLGQSAAFSTITLELFPDVVAQPIEVARWLPAEVAERAIEALAETMQSLANFVIWVTIYFMPVGLVIGLPTWFIGRWAWRKWGKGFNRPVTPAVATTPNE
ncbi:MAG: DUF4349 domain-containing protein [Chloroflexota bacterium]